MSGQRAAARIARRELRRRPVTTLLVALLVAVPVAAMVVAVAAVRTYPVPVEVVDQQAVGNGVASFSTASPDAAGAAARIREASPDARIVPVQIASGYLRAPDDEQVHTTISGGDFADPVIRDRYRLAEGAMPTEPGELAISTAFAERWGLAVGDRLVADELDLDGHVVGIATTVHDRGTNQVFATSFPDLEPATVTEQLFIADPYGFDDETLAVLGDLGKEGTLRLRSDVDAPSTSLTAVAGSTASAGTELAVAATWGGGALALAVMGIVMSSAFAIGARRQLRTLGLLAANGAPPGVVRGAVIWQGLWTGALGTVLGVGLGAVALVGLRPFRGSILGYDPTGWVWSPRDLLPIVALGVLAPTLAAALPARTAGRLSVLQSLAGRRPLAPVRPRLIVGGILTAVAGLALLAGATLGAEWKPWRQGLWTTVGVVGGLAVLTGAVAAAPVAVGVAGRFGGRAEGSLKLALRNVGRQRSRSSAVVAGITAAAALCLGVGAATASTQRQSDERQARTADHIASVSAWSQTNAGPAATTVIGPDGLGQVTAQTYQPTFAPTPVELLDEIQAAVPDTVRIDTPVVRASGVWPDDRQTLDAAVNDYLNTRGPRAAPATPALLDALDVGADARAALDRGEVVALGAPASLERLILTGYLSRAYTTGSAGSVAVTPFPNADAWYGLPSVLLPPAVADEVGLTAAPDWDAAHLFISPDRISDDEWAAINAINGPRGGDFGRFRLAGDPEPVAQQRWPAVELVTWSPPRPSGELAPLLLTSAATLVFTAFVVALGLALAARDTRDERDVLEAVGAPPRLLRRLAGTRAALLALIGALVALPTGLLPVWVVERASRPVVPFVVPWASVIAVVVVIPVVIGLGALVGAALTSWRRPTIGSRFATD